MSADEANEQAKFRDVADFALDLGTDRMESSRNSSHGLR